MQIRNVADKHFFRYMATKTQEKKNLQREVQLDRKVKSLEEELQRTKEQLNRESLVHEVKKAKVFKRKLNHFHVSQKIKIKLNKL